MNTRSEGLHPGRVSPSTLALLVLGALLTFMAASPQTAFGASYLVDTTSDANLTTCSGDAGDCSLRGAMNNAVASGGADTITFDTSVFPRMYLGMTYYTTITLGSALPDLSNTSDTVDAGNAGVDVFGSSGFDCFTMSGTLNAIRGLEGVRGCASGISVTGTGNVIGGTNVAESSCGTDTTDDDSDGLVNDGCPASGAPESGSLCWNSADDDGDTLVNDGCLAGGAGSYIHNNSLTGSGVRINGEGADGNLVKGNYIAANGTGITIDGGADSNQAGTSLAGTGNLIVGNTYDGVYIAGSGTTGNTVKGSFIGSGNDTGVRIDVGATGNTVGGTTAGERNIISGNVNWGVGITGSASTGNVVAGNYIGTDVTGTLDLGNGTDGVRIETGATGNTIGGMAAGERNVISGNAGMGVRIEGAGTTGNMVKGNYIGVGADGSTAIANYIGVYLTGSDNTTIGGTAAGARNVISGNGTAGVYTAGSTPNNILGNYIGIDSSGTLDRGNGGCGLEIYSGSNTIGGAAAGAGNVISGNDSAGVCLQGVLATSNVVRGNYIGTNAAGTLAIANTNPGVFIDSGASSNTIGGTTAADRNVISGNLNAGVYLNDDTSDSNVIQGNYIGTTASGASALANAYGIELFNGDNNVIGGVTAGAGNLIAYNTNDGVWLESIGFVALTNSVRGNSIHSNGALGVNLGGGGVTANDAYPDSDSGANNLQNFPVITSASYNGINTTVGGHGGSPGTFADGTYSIDVYANAAADASGNGEGQVYLGSTSFVTAGGGGTWSLSFAGLPSYPILTATATDTLGNTSEFSAIFHTDLDGDSITSATDDCPLTYNPYQMDHDADGIGDVCDSVVRNRLSSTSSSLIDEYTTAPGEELPTETQMFHSWDYNAASTIDIGSVVGELDFSFVVSVGNTPCYFGVTNDNRTLYNASVDNSPGNLVSTANILTNFGGDPNLVDGIEKYPSFLNAYLDPERLTGINNDGDGLIDEDGPDGVNSDGDVDSNGAQKIDEDPAGAPLVPHARYFGTYGGSSFFQILVFEIVPNSLYRRVVVFNDPTIAMFPTVETCAPLEFRSTINTMNADNPATGTVEGSDAVLGTAAAGTHVAKLEVVQPPDKDGDGDVNYRDNCPSTANADQADSDADGIGNACEPASGPPCFSDAVLDCDADTVYNLVDNCPTIANASQADSEKRTPLPFGAYYVGDAIGDACDTNPTLTDGGGEELAITRYSDGVCVTGGGVTDADFDGWCGGTTTEDPDDSFATGATVAPENASVSIGSCTNGVDDDGVGGIDFADAGCTDSDGDLIPDAVDICDAAADPLQLDADGDAQGDACEDDDIVTLSLSASTNAAAAEMRRRLVEVAPRPIHKSDGIVNLVDPNWNIVGGSLVTDGAIRASLTSMITVAIDPNPEMPTPTWKPCNNVVPLNYTLVDASTNPADTITSGGAGFPNLVGDSDADGRLNGVEQYPSFLLNLRDASNRVDNDADAARDEDLPDGIDNDQDGAVDEDPYDPIAPLVRMFGDSGAFYGTHHVFNVLIYSPGSLPNYAMSDGFIVMLIDDDPTAPSANPSLPDVCSHEDHHLIEYGISIDNPAVSGSEGNIKLMFNDSAPVTERFLTQVTSLPDQDGDGIENGLDVCFYDPDNDVDTINDNVDTTPWNPRLVAPPGDVDLDGIPKACDANDGAPNLPSFGGRTPRTNLLDNCPNDVNPDQTDSDADGIGDRCDTQPTVHNGGVQQVVNGTPVCTGGTNLDGDNFCNDVDPNDNQFSNIVFVPEATAIYPPACVDDADNDNDMFIDEADDGCGDYDVDGVPNQLDNCPGRPPASGGAANDNLDQADNDNDGIRSANTLQSQPYARSSGDAPEGDPATVLGTPYARSDRFGGDVCDPDDDNDGLPDDDEPNFTCPANPGPGEVPKLASKDLDGDCDNDLLKDLWEFGESACGLSITVPNNPGADADGDGLSNYAEGTIGTDPCVPESGDTFSADLDLDGFISAHERYIIAQASTATPQSYTDRCGVGASSSPSIAWPSDLIADGGSTDRITLVDLTSFLAPVRRLDTIPGNAPTSVNYNRRWDLVPGAASGNFIQLNDLTALLAGTTGFPPMLSGQRAFGGPVCTPP